MKNFGILVIILFFVMVFAFVVFSTFQNADRNALITECETHLSRDQSCVLIAVPLETTKTKEQL